MERNFVSAAQVLDAVEAQAPTVERTLAFVHDHPELAHDEQACAAFLSGLLEEGGLEVERLTAGLPTAFTATLSGAQEGPSIGIVVVYDAVPAVAPDGTLRPIHACGHGPIAAGVVGAMLGLERFAERLPGRITAVGCPADEVHAPGTVAKGGGKALTAAAGVWDGFDAALYVHPEFVDTVWQSSMWMRRERVLFSGLRSLRAAGKQAVNETLAALLATVARRPPANVLLESAVLDGDVEEGSSVTLRADVLVTGQGPEQVDAWAAEIRDDVPDGSWLTLSVLPGIRPDARLTRSIRTAFEEAGREFICEPPPLPFATDFGSISRRVPAALIGVGHAGGWAFHTERGAEQFASPEGLEAAHDVARLLALSVKEVCAST